jgi:two-component system, OmpR family, phosphate regulon sensor histidine kinase PhoR
VREDRQVEDAPGEAAGTREVVEFVDWLRPLDRTGAQLLCAASHQLRTPLTSIAGYLELLVDGAVGPVTAEQERLLQTVTRNVSRLMTLIDALAPGDPPVRPW